MSAGRVTLGMRRPPARGRRGPRALREGLGRPRGQAGWPVLPARPRPPPSPGRAPLWLFNPPPLSLSFLFPSVFHTLPAPPHVFLLSCLIFHSFLLSLSSIFSFFSSLSYPSLFSSLSPFSLPFFPFPFLTLLLSSYFLLPSLYFPSFLSFLSLFSPFRFCPLLPSLTHQLTKNAEPATASTRGDKQTRN